MPNRREQIELLIASQYDQLWFPAGSLKSTRGLAPGKKIPCPDCGGHERQDDFGKTILRDKGRGWIEDSFKRRYPCAKCGGRTTTESTPLDDAMFGEDGPVTVEHHWGSGWIEVDSGDTAQAVIGSEGTQASSRPRKTVACDACSGEGATAKGRCGRCDGSGRRDLHVFDLSVDLAGDRAERWKGIDPQTLGDKVDGRFMSRRDQAGSYRELEQALAALARASYSARRLIDQVYAFQIVKLDTLTVLAREKLEYGMKYLELRMPDVVRVPADVVANRRIRANHVTAAKGKGQALPVRDSEVRRAIFEDHKATAEVASVYGLSVSQVNRICAKRTEAA